MLAPCPQMPLLVHDTLATQIGTRRATIVLAANAIMVALPAVPMLSP